MTEFVSNHGYNFDLGWINKVNVNLSAIKQKVAALKQSINLRNEYKAAWSIKALTCIDLTTLAGDDTESNVSRLCYKAKYPLSPDIVKALGFDYEDNKCPIKTAAVCVYPAKVPIARKVLTELNADINIASVATGFPSGQMPLESRLQEIRFAIAQGANEIDVVIDRSLVLKGQWNKLYHELTLMKDICGSQAHMKTILATGELGDLNNVYKASLVAMMAGSDFIKTSTGKETLNATIIFGIVMCRAIREYYIVTGYKVGLKPAGGIKTTEDALSWLILVREELGKEWCYPNLFRIGASGLLTDIERQLYTFVTGHYPASNEFEIV